MSRERVRFWRKGLLKGALLLLAAIEPGAAWCDDIAPAQFNIPAQDLDVALDAFSRQSGIVGVYDGRMVAHQVSSAVRGMLKPEDALGALLTGTGLAAEFTSRASFIVVYRDKATALAGNSVAIGYAALASQDSAQRRFSGLLQQTIEGALCSDALTRAGDYRAALSFRVDPNGAVRRMRLLSSTGDARRDAVIVAVAGQISVSEAPPAHMSQPFAMVVLARQSGATLDCQRADRLDRR